MALESKLLAVPAQIFTANGTSDGQIIIADPALFKIRQIVIVGSGSQPSIELQIKRIANGVIHVGPFDDNLETRSDLSLYTAGSFIFANEQLRPWIPRDGVIPNFKELDYTYEEAPTVAQRVIFVGKDGEAVDVVEVSGVRRLAVETSVSVETTSSGVQDVNVVNQPTIDSITNVVRISGIVDFQRPVHVIVDDAPESVATISGIISVSGVSEQPVRIDHVVNISGVVDIQRPLDVNVISSTPVNIPEPLDVNVVNSLPQHNVTVSGVVNISGIVDFQRPVHVIVDNEDTVTTISGVVVVSGVAEQPVRIDQVVRVSGIVDIQRPLDVNVISSTPVNVPEPLDVTVINSLLQHNVTVSGIVNISGVVDIQRPLNVISSGVADPFIAGITDFTRFPLMGSHHTITISYTAPDLIEYVGWAEPIPGLSKASPVWRIAKLTYSGTSILDMQWAAGNRLFNKVWNDRTTYLYA